MDRATGNMKASENLPNQVDAAAQQQSAPHRTRIKLCGLSKPEDITQAIDLGADAIGLVFYPPSPRSVSVAQAVELVRDVPPFVSVVGLFVNATAPDIADPFYLQPFVWGIAVVAALLAAAIWALRAGSRVES